MFNIINKLKKETPSNLPISYIVAGLGNPGDKYKLTRHNAGFLAIDFICQEFGGQPYKSKFDCLYSQVIIDGKKILLLKPQTFMNNSGHAIAKAVCFYKIPIENVIIIFDDISLPPGKLRIKRKGSDGGHNGIKDIIALLGNSNFPRIKLGIGNKPNPKYNLADWVLSKFNENDLNSLNPAIKNASSALELIINGQIDKAMNLYN